MPARIAVMGLAIPEPAILKEQGSWLCTGSKIQAEKTVEFFPPFFRLYFTGKLFFHLPAEKSSRSGNQFDVRFRCRRSGIFL